MELLGAIYSIAGTSNEEVNSILRGIDRSVLTKKENLVIEEMINSFQTSGQFLSIEYLKSNYGRYERFCKNVSDLRHFLDNEVAERKKSNMISSLNEAIVSSGDLSDLRDKILKVTSDGTLKAKTKITLPTSMSDTYSIRKANMKGLFTGVRELDDITNGWQAGLVHSICAFTSHGKSTWFVNAAYSAVASGKKVAYLSLEIPSELVYLQLYSRHSFAMGKAAISFSDISTGKLNKDTEEYLFKEVEPSFKDLPGKFLVIEQYDIINYTYDGIMTTLKEIENLLGGLDYLIVDHVNLFQYLSSGRDKLTGDDYIKNFTDVAKSYKTEDGGRIALGFAVQTNREGYKKAKKNEGRYDITAISEFREIERSSTYVTFLYADQSMTRVNEMKVQMVKNRTGSTMQDPAVANYQPAYGVVGESYQVSTDSEDLASVVGDFFSDSGLDDFGF